MTFVAHNVELIEIAYGPWNAFATEDDRFRVFVHIGQGKVNGWYIEDAQSKTPIMTRWVGSLDRACEVIEDCLTGASRRAWV